MTNIIYKKAPQIWESYQHRTLASFLGTHLMPPPDILQALGDGSLPSGSNPQPITKSFAAVTAGPSSMKPPRLAPVPIAKSHISYIDDVQAILFTPIEVEQLHKQRDNTLIMNFSSGGPQVHEIHAHIVAEWNLAAPPAVGYIYPRHVSIHMASYADTTKALALNKYKMKNNLFCLFRWSPEFKIGKESPMAAVWVKLHDLPLQFYNESSLHCIGSVLGNVIRICPKIINLIQQWYARIYVELDVREPLLATVFIGTSKEE